MHQSSIHSHGGITMNEISNLVKFYNSFIGDLEQLNQDIREIILKYDVEWKYEAWLPRDRPFWSVKKTFASKYQNKNEVFYVGFNLEDDCPYLLLERMYALKECTSDEFDCDNHCFEYVNNLKIEKNKDNFDCNTFECDWGKCIFAEIGLLEITSQEIVNTDIQFVIDYLFKRNKLSLKTIKLM